MFLQYSLVRLAGMTLILSFFLFGSKASEEIHECSGAGFWFPGNPDKLKMEVDGYLTQATQKELQGDIVALISPHAGYFYAGPVMGVDYKQIKGEKYKRVIILALSHSSGGFGKISVLPVKAYETPLGNVPVDQELVKELLKHSDVFISIPSLHASEHSDENQIPFLQRSLEKFSLVSLIVDHLDQKTMNKAVEILSPYVGNDTLFVASTDLNHYGIGYGYAPFRNLEGKALVDRIHEHDREALKYMANLDAEGFQSYLDKTGATVCGKNPVELLIRILKKKGNIEGHILDYYTSADKEGDHEDRTCGYGAVVFALTSSPAEHKEDKGKDKQEKTGNKNSTPESGEPDPPTLSHEEQETLLKLSRDMLAGITKNRSYRPDLSQYDLTQNLKEKSRLFVTLTKKGELRGCIGHVEAISPIYEAVLENTFSAAFSDPRFPAVKASEVPDIRIEISINTPQRLISDVNKIEIGKHGLIIENGWNRGLLLPQVPVEWGWDRDEFLKGICRKAGLPNGAWKDPDTKLYVYSSQVFHEKEETK
ncbi:AmmeMemoRadiSam system protein B [Candidatus Sumerlaeota bacterium]|nr:AmmeMemoRadiSam system protein B [Candidatus Sumerlaeota bacterium]